MLRSPVGEQEVQGLDLCCWSYSVLSTPEPGSLLQAVRCEVHSQWKHQVSDNLLVVDEEDNSVPSSVPSLRPPTREQILAHVYGVLEIPAQAVQVLSRRGVTSVRSFMQLQRIQIECFRNEEPQNLPIVHVE